MRKLDAGVHVVSGTPGRVKDMMEKQKLRTRAIKLLMLDEADEMLNLSFQEQIYNCYRYLPPDSQVDGCGMFLAGTMHCTTCAHYA